MITDWQKLINRLQSEIENQLRNNHSAKDQGMVMIELRLLAGCDGPVIWTVDSKRIEPGSRARELLLG